MASLSIHGCPLSIHTMNSLPYITMIQPGARHNYALGQFLSEAGMLQRLYTDFALGREHPLRFIGNLLPSETLRRKLRRRTTDSIPWRKISGFSLASIARPGYVGNLSRLDMLESDGFFTQYFVLGSEILRMKAKRPLISDVHITPSAFRIEEEEARRFPDWGGGETHHARVEKHRTITHQMLNGADVLFCPSEAVIEDISSWSTSARERCRLVPYGSSLSFAGVGTAEPGRMLFCGNLQLRKGVQYIRAAADLLRNVEPRIRFVLAGSAAPAVRAKMRAENIEVLGPLGRDRLIEEYQCADAFVFPSLAEGAAGALLEGMAAGLPLIATRAAGVDFTDGKSGIVVAERDPEAIASAVLQIFRDRELRASMAESARREALQYDMPAWRERFIQAVRDVF